MPSYKQRKQKLRELVRREEEERARKIEEQGHKFQDTDAFKRAEKHYKYYMHRNTDFSPLLKVEELPVQQVAGKRVYKLPYPEGAYLVREFSNVQQQYQIGFQALNRYIHRPYRTNLDGTNGLYQKQQQAQQLMAENLNATPQDCLDQDGRVLYYFNEKIRMTNLGYQYDWPKRCYPSMQVCVPQTITAITRKAVNLFQLLTGSKLDYKGEAVIVNFYKPRDYMTGHLDDGEIDQRNPIFSYCFGLSCVFLIGYPDKEREPLAVELRAGDLMIMSGFSRICYHGVPRIIQNSYTEPSQEQLDKVELAVPGNSQDIKFLNQKQEIRNYFRRHRVNINIRQVFPSEEKGRSLDQAN